MKWQKVDAQSLPFEAGSFDVVACCFGMMFMPDKQAAYREALRVLRPKGRFIFTVWDRLETNPLMDVADATVAGLFPEDPPHFLARTPCGYNDKARIERDAAGSRLYLRRRSRKSNGKPLCLRQASPRWDFARARRCAARSRPVLRTGWFGRPTAVAAALRKRFGDGPFRTSQQALLVTAVVNTG